MTLILNDIVDIAEVTFKDMDEFKKIIEANVEFDEISKDDNDDESQGELNGSN